MRVVFFGTPEFALPSLEALTRNHEVLAVCTQPDKPRGRKLMLTPSPVKEFALSKGITVYEPRTLKKNDAFFETLKGLQADVFVVAAYGHILPGRFLCLPVHGSVNVHASLLPKYRGASPIHAALLFGDKTTGVTIMQMDTGLDTGDMILSVETEIAENDDFVGLHNRLAQLGADALTDALCQIGAGTAKRTPQDSSLSSYAPTIKKSDGKINWEDGTGQILNRIRAFSVWPGCFTMTDAGPLKINSGERFDTNSTVNPGMAIYANQNEGLVIKTGDGAIRVLELTPSGGKKMSPKDFLRGRREIKFIF